MAKCEYTRWQTIYENGYQFQDLRDIGEQMNRTEEHYVFADAEMCMETVRNFTVGSQAITNDVVADDVLRNGVESQQYIATVHHDSPQQHVLSSSHRVSQMRETNSLLLEQSYFFP